MGITSAFLISICFIVSVLALFAFIWSLGNEATEENQGAEVIFDKGEEGHPEEPACLTPIATKNNVSESDVILRLAADQSSKNPVLLFFLSAMTWLIVGSIAGMISSLKLHIPDLLVATPELTFGRVRPVHLNAVVYGWGSMAGIGVMLWLLPRLLKTGLVGNRYATTSGIVWNIGMLVGCIQLLYGFGDGKEFLEFHWTTDILFVIAGGLAAIPLFLTLLNKRVGHFYVSGWYFSAALVWFPILALLGNFPYLFSGAEQAILNWWFGHNVLGLWVTPIAVGTAYYFIPKVLGVPIHSYRLSLIGFWALALFYSQVGAHHLIGGPVPMWLQTLSIIQSVMMVVPVIAFTINISTICKGRISAIKHSPTLRFILFGALMYTASSIQGSMEAIRSVNYLVHFTHYTVGHAHLGLYAFFTMILFGAMYFIMPRLTGNEWPHKRLISLHFWLVLIGVAIYVVALTIGGVLQGLALADPTVPFNQSTDITLPYLQARTFGGLLMTAGHFVFAYHLMCIVFKKTKTTATTNLPSTHQQQELIQ